MQLIQFYCVDPHGVVHELEMVSYMTLIVLHPSWSLATLCIAFNSQIVRHSRGGQITRFTGSS